MVVQKLSLLGDSESYDPLAGSDFSLISVVPIRPALRYIETFRGFDPFEQDKPCRPVEIGRCEIGSQWGTPWLWIHSFEIAESERGKYYGQDFFKEIKLFAKRHGFSYIWLDPKNDGARKFWVKQGGVPVNDLGDIGLVPADLDNKHLVFDLNADDVTQGV